MLPIKIRIFEDACQEKEIAEVSPFLKVLVHIRQRPSEGLDNHLTVLFSNYLISGTTGWEDGLFSDGLHLRHDLSALSYQDTLKDSCGIIDNIRECLLVGPLWGHVDCLDDYLCWVLLRERLVDLDDNSFDLFIRHEGECSDESNHELALKSILEAQCA